MRISARLRLVAALAAALVPAATARAGDDAAPAAASEGVQFLPGDPSFGEVLAKAAEQKKPVFLDFFTDT